MEIGIQSQPIASTQENGVAVQKPVRLPYFVRLFRGRLNRQNYATGSLILIIIPAVIYFIFVWQLVTSPSLQAIILNNPYDPNALQNSNFSPETQQRAITALLESPVNLVLMIIMVIYGLISLPTFLSLQIRRLHDLNKSGWLIVLYFVPLVNYIFPLYVTFFKGTEGENNFGLKPLKRTHIKEDILML